MSVLTKRAQLLVSLFLLAFLTAPAFAPAAQAAAPSSAHVTLLPNREYADALLTAIGGAKRRIVCSFYLFRIGEGRKNLPRLVARELARAVERGVAVTVILENNGREDDNIDQDNSLAASFLARKGVKVYFDSPDVTSHAKMVIIDGSKVFLGSHNITQSALSRNNEMSVFIDSPEMASRAISIIEAEFGLDLNKLP